MDRQFQIVFVGVLIFTLFLSLSGCASAPTPTLVPPPTATASIPPLPTATIAPSATPTKLPATATTAPSVTATKPTIAATVAPTQAAVTNPATQPTTTTAAVGKDVCLGCHGPFDKLVSATANYVWPNGDKQSPHRYVPHDSTEVLECSNCHKPHPLPPSASDIAAMANPNPKWCYSCHHTGTLTCGTCHPVPDACSKRSATSCGP